ncbi:Ig-like domain-containing protein [Parahaliea mediterranea]|uniref:Tandem-95 repeat protein n=1 Tax=Parahaliea mediterranea TaxID=651086 RepID=A0A939DBY1_9GAMM|nr:Ig-like domain-containing protein [Parahaliea mediterranea]MBN7795250.1 tandem-95 repeat protein [Parahaliea mediterranea]
MRTPASIFGVFLLGLCCIWSTPGFGAKVVQLSLDEGSGTQALDGSGQGNHGELIGGPAYESGTADGSAYALRLDGVNDWVDLGNLDVAGAGLTLAVWFKADSFPGAAQDPRLLSKAVGLSDNEHVFMLSTIRSGDAVRLRGRVRVGGSTRTLIADTGNLLTGVWQHAALTHDGSTLRLYLDGQLVGSAPLAGAMDVDPSMGVAVGAQPGGGNRLFAGLLDRVQILDRALDAGEVLALVTGNGAPQAAADEYAVSEDTPLSVVAGGGVLSNDTDPEGDPLQAELVDDAAHGGLVLNADGSFDYTPGADYVGTDTFTYRASDGLQFSSLAQVSLVVGDVADAPLAVDDTYLAVPGESLAVAAGSGVLANDTDVDSVTLQAVLEAGVSNGQLSLSPDGSFTYSPDVGYDGSDSFRYRASDGELESESATVTIIIATPPVAMADAYTVNEDELWLTTALDGLLLNDIDSSGALDLVAELVSGPVHGTLQSLGADGAFSYLPAANFVGDDSFVYRAVDGGTGASAEATVTLTVLAVNDPPVALADSYQISENGALVVGVADGVLANDTDVDGDSLQNATLVDDVDHGTLALNADGSFTYMPEAGYRGADLFSYTVGDGLALSNTATVTIDVQAELPVISGSVVQLSLDEGSGTQALDGSGQGNHGELVGGPAYESGTADGSAYALRLDGVNDWVDLGNLDVAGAGLTLAVWFKADSYPGAAQDPRLLSKAAGLSDNEHVFMLSTIRSGGAVRLRGRVRVGGSTRTLIADAGNLLTGVWQHAALTHDGSTLRLYLDGQLVGSVPLAGAMDVDPSMGVAVGAQPGGGSRLFAGLLDRVQILDRALDAGEVLVLASGNGAPQAVADEYAVSEDTPLSVAVGGGVLSNDTDPEGDPLQAELVEDVAHGGLVLNADGSFDYTPGADYSGSDTFVYRAVDGSTGAGAEATVTLTVLAVNDPPVALADSYQASENGALVVGVANGVLANDTDVDGDPLHNATLVEDVDHGTLALNADGSFTYMPEAGYRGADLFSYTVGDGLALSNTATVTIDVQAELPVIPGSVVQLSLDEGGGTQALDGSGQGNHGELVGGPAYESGTADGSAYALRLDGVNDWVDLGNLDVAGAGLTLAVWFKADSYPGAAQDPRLLSKAVGLSDNEHVFMLSTIRSGGAVRLRGRVRVGGSTRTLIADAGNLLTGVWQHAALTHDGATLRLYLDGQLVGSVPLAGAMDVDPSMGVAVGAQPGGGSRLFAGLLDRVQILDRALDAGEVLALVTGNGAPQAVADEYAVSRDTPLSVAAGGGVLSNDTDPEGDPLQAELVDDVAHGSLALNADGSFDYTPGAGYIGTDTFTYRARDGLQSSSPVAVGLTVGGLVSDDFVGTSLDPGVWTLVDPLGGGQASAVGGRLVIDVPAGQNHEPWVGGNSAVRVMQSAADEDFQVEVKFDSVGSQVFQMQGVLAEQDGATFVRAGFYHDGSQIRVFTAVIDGGNSVVQANLALPGAVPPLYARLAREGDSWTHSYSMDGGDWQVAATFTQPLSVSAVGIYGGNSGSPAPAHAALADYFMNLAAPLERSYVLSRETTGRGAVVATPDQGSYAPGSAVTVEAKADPGWLFHSWSGDLAGAGNPAQLTMDGNVEALANFVQDCGGLAQYSLGISTSGSGLVAADPAVGCSPGSALYPEGAVVTLTALPDTGWMFEGWSGDLAGAVSPASITMSGDAVVQAHFSPVPVPEYTLTVATSGAGAVTLDPAGGTYEEGTVVTLTAAPEAGWLFESWDGDLAGTVNPQTLTVTADALVQANFIEPGSASGLVSDDFVGTSLDPGVWTLVDPLGGGQASAVGGRLVIDVPAGQNHEPWGGGNSAVRVMQSAADEDFLVEVKFDSAGSQAFQMQGVLAEQDGATFVRAGIYHDGSQVRVFTAFIDGGNSVVQANLALPGAVPPLYARLAREGDSWTHSYSMDGGDWQVAATFTQPLSVSAVGIYGGNSGSPAPAHAALADYFMNLAAPLERSYVLSRETTGRGAVVATPDQGSYAPGSAVTVEAQADPGWLFHSWSGDLAGAGNPAQLTMDGNVEALANFVQDCGGLAQYSLGISTSGPGLVAVDPAVGCSPGSALYPEGAVVTLTALPDTGWMFEGWSGDLAGAVSPASITMSGDAVVQAHFSPVPVPEYTLTVATSGAGAVTLDPAGGTYAEGTVVTLTAAPEAGWLFEGWDGDLTGTVNPLAAPVDGDMTVTAIFREIGGSGPILSNVVVQPTGPTTATVTWSTDVGAVSRADYGITTQYGASASSEVYEFEHSLELDWLRCEQSYALRLTSEAFSGDSGTASLVFTTADCPHPGIGSAPSITLFDDNVLTFGDRGRAQRWINVRGRVATAHALNSLTYALNGGNPENLNVGPDSRRLAGKGDFNVEIDYTQLVPGANQLVIRAEDDSGRSTSETVTVVLDTTTLDPDYTVDWSLDGTVERWAYPVDGEWSVENGEVASRTLDYDRLLVIGDVGWTDYEVTVPVTVHEHGPHAYVWQSGSPLVGLAIRWPGHTPLGSEQPSQYWFPAGAFAWYLWGSGYELIGSDNSRYDSHVAPLVFGVRYVFKVQVETLDATDTRYRFKVWEEAEPEPLQWHMEFVTDQGPVSGAIGLLAHHADARFGNVEVKALVNPEIPSTPENLVAVPMGASRVDLFWDASIDDVGVTEYQIYRDSILVATVTDTRWTDGNAGGGPYLYEVRAGDEAGNQSEAAVATVTAIGSDSGAWWDSNWRYRTLLSVGSAEFPREGRVAELDVNFTQLIADLGASGEVDLSTLRCHEVDANGAVVSADIPFQFVPAINFDPVSNAVGDIVIYMSGLTPQRSARYFHLYFDTLGGGSTPSPGSAPLVALTDDVFDEDQYAYEIQTQVGTYLFQKQGGAFSSVLDNNGNDWVDYHPTGGSAGNFRGIPNLVYPEGHFHPGSLGATSSLVHHGPVKVVVDSQTNDGLWKTRWEFYPNRATMTVLAAARPYWFLYEGTPGGVFDANSDFSVRSDGSTALLSSSWSGDLPADQWVYFADPVAGRSLFLAQHEDDLVIDSYRPQEGVMTVFGFGRNELESLITSVPASFSMGLIDATDFSDASELIESAIKPLELSVSVPAALD